MSCYHILYKRLLFWSQSYSDFLSVHQWTLNVFVNVRSSTGFSVRVHVGCFSGSIRRTQQTLCQQTLCHQPVDVLLLPTERLQSLTYWLFQTSIISFTSFISLNSLIGSGAGLYEGTRPELNQILVGLCSAELCS